MIVLNLCLAAPLMAQEMEDENEFIFVGEDEGITVSASPLSTSQITVIDRAEIERLNAPDLAALLQESAGVGLVRYGPYGNQTDITMRGFDSERIAFLIDGVPVNSPVSGDFDLSLVDLNTVKRIELIYGGSDARYNVTGALGGVVNIITAERQEQKLRLSGSVSNTAFMPGEYYQPNLGPSSAQWQDIFDTQALSLSLGLGFGESSLSTSFFANRAGNHFLFEDYYGRTLRREGNEVWDTGFAASFVKDLPRYAQFSATGSLYYGDKNIPLSGISSEARKQEDFASRQSLSLKVPRVFGAGLSTEASLAHEWNSRSYGGSSRHDYRIVSAINRWSWSPVNWLNLNAGADFRAAFLDSSDMGMHERGDGGVYLSAEYRPLKQVLIIPALKAVFSGSQSSPVVFVPKLGFLWHASKSLSIKNNYFRSFKIPDFEDLYWNGEGMRGDPALKPEDGFGMDIGAVYDFKERMHIEGGFFTQWTADSIHWYGADGVWKPTNVGEAVFFGLDAKLRITIPLSAHFFERIDLSLSYEYLLTYLLSYGYDYRSDKRIPYMPLHRAGFSMIILLNEALWGRGASFTLGGQYEGLRYADTANLSKLKPYFLLNASFSRRISSKFSIFMNFRNILNQSYESFNDYYMPALNVTVGIRAGGLTL